MKWFVFAVLVLVPAIWIGKKAVAQSRGFSCQSYISASFYDNPNELTSNIANQCDTTKPFSFSLAHNPSSDSYSGEAVVCCTPR